MDIDMKKYFANYKQSLALKQLGFDEDCFGVYRPESDKNYYVFYINPDDRGSCNSDLDGTHTCSAPLSSQVFEFFRNKFNLHHYIEAVIVEKAKSIIKFDYTILEENTELIEYNDLPSNTYKEAEIACIDKLIEIALSYENL